MPAVYSAFSQPHLDSSLTLHYTTLWYWATHTTNSLSLSGCSPQGTVVLQQHFSPAGQWPSQHHLSAVPPPAVTPNCTQL